MNFGISGVFGDDILETKKHIMRVSKRSFSGNVFVWSIWQPSGHRRTDGQVLCHSVLVGLAFGTVWFGAAQFSQIVAPVCPVSAQNWNICPIVTVHINSSWIYLCVCVLHFGSFPPNIYIFMFLFHAHVTPVSKCIANCLPFKLSPSYHFNFKQAPELLSWLCVTLISIHPLAMGLYQSSVHLRICSKFNPWKQLTGRMSEFFWGEVGGFKWQSWRAKTPQRIGTLKGDFAIFLGSGTQCF